MHFKVVHYFSIGYIPHFFQDQKQKPTKPPCFREQNSHQFPPSQRLRNSFNLNNRQFINFFCSLSSKLLQLQTFFILVHKPWPRLCTTLTTSTKCHTNGVKVAHVQVLLFCQKFQKFSLELKWTGLFWFGLVTRIFGMSTLTGLTNWSNASSLTGV